MSDRTFDRIADAFLASGPVVLPDRVLDAAFEEVHRTRQRRVLWLAPWRFPSMNTFAKFAVAGVAVIAIGLVGLSFLNGSGTGGGAAPTASPSATPSPSPTPSGTPTPSPVPTAPPLTGQFPSERNGFSIAYPAGWSTRAATEPWVSGFVDFGHPGGDVLYEPSNEAHLFVALASQPLGDRTREEWEAEIFQLQADDQRAADCSTRAEPVTIDGAPGVICGDQLVLVTEGGRGYFILLYTSGDEPWLGDVYDRAWFESLLATLELHPEDAVDEAASPSPS